MNIIKGLENIKVMMDKLPEGPQKQYFKDVVIRIENGEKINPSDFIKGMENETFKNVDVEGLKEKEAKANKIYQQWENQ